jgi:hypothetical protein
MRADPQPVLFERPYCAGCPLCCPEKNTDAACDERGAARFAVSPAMPDVFEQFLRWSPRPATPGLPVPIGEVPAYMTILPREAVPLALEEVQGPLVFTLRDFLTLTRKAERLGVELRELLATRGRRVVSSAPTRTASSFGAGSAGRWSGPGS